MAKNGQITLHSQEADTLVELVEDYLEKLDREMEIGQYSAPDDPPAHWDEEIDGDYHEECLTAVNLASSARMKLDEFIRNYKGKDK